MNLFFMLDEAGENMLGGRVHNCTHIKISMYGTLLEWARYIKTERIPRFIGMEEMSFVPGICDFIS